MSESGTPAAENATNSTSAPSATSVAGRLRRAFPGTDPAAEAQSRSAAPAPISCRNFGDAPFPGDHERVELALQQLDALGSESTTLTS
jgi:hypothetical protein